MAFNVIRLAAMIQWLIHLKLLERVHDKLWVKHYSIGAEQAYLDWIDAIFCFMASVIRRRCARGEESAGSVGLGLVRAQLMFCWASPLSMPVVAMLPTDRLVPSL